MSRLSAFTAYSANLLLQPERERRVRARDWYQRIIDFTAAAGAQSTGGHIGAYSVADWRGPGPRGEVWRGPRGALRPLPRGARAPLPATLRVAHPGPAPGHPPHTPLPP